MGTVREGVGGRGGGGGGGEGGGGGGIGGGSTRAADLEAKPADTCDDTVTRSIAFTSGLCTHAHTPRGLLTLRLRRRVLLLFLLLLLLLRLLLISSSYLHGGDGGGETIRQGAHSKIASKWV